MNQRALEQFRAAFHGEVVAPGDPTYEQARRVHNGLIDRHPALVARCRGIADVAAGIQLAKAEGSPLAIRGGGHSVAGHGTCDDGVVIDLSLMRGVRVDPQARTVRVQGGATLGDLDRETQVFGLATPTGQVSQTGIAGLTLNGGMGALQRKHGLTCDNLLSVDLVTAEGRAVVASDVENPELFWALRGGGGNFGVVTSFEFALHPVGPMVVVGLVAYPVEQAVEVLEFLRDFIETAPEELSADAIFQFAPPLEVIAEEVRGQPVVGIFVRYCGPVEEGLRAVRPIQEFGKPIIDLVLPAPYVAMQSLLDPLNPRGYLNYWTGEYLPELGSKAIETIAEHGSNLPSHQSIIQVIPFNAAATRVSPDATAFAHREDSWLIHALGQWPDLADTDRCRGWAKQTVADLSALGSGDVYLNLVTDDEETDRVRAFWKGERLARLQRIKGEYDPDNLFRMNHNIQPARPGPSGATA